MLTSFNHSLKATGFVKFSIGKKTVKNILSKNKIAIWRQNCKIARDYKISHFVITTFKKEKSFIIQSFTSISTKTKKIRNSNYDQVVKKLIGFKTTDQKHRHQQHYFNSKANGITKFIGIVDFECTTSWIQRFRNRNSAVQSSIFKNGKGTCREEGMWVSVSTGGAVRVKKKNDDS